VKQGFTHCSTVDWLLTSGSHHPCSFVLPKLLDSTPHAALAVINFMYPAPGSIVYIFASYITFQPLKRAHGILTESPCRSPGPCAGTPTAHLVSRLLPAASSFSFRFILVALPCNDCAHCGPLRCSSSSFLSVIFLHSLRWPEGLWRQGVVHPHGYPLAQVFLYLYFSYHLQFGNSSALLAFASPERCPFHRLPVNKRCYGENGMYSVNTGM
jgi:hypothetical protein